MSKYFDTVPSLSSLFSFLSRIYSISFFTYILVDESHYREQGPACLGQDRLDLIILICVLVSQGHEPWIIRTTSLNHPVGERSILFCFIFLMLKIEMNRKQMSLILTYIVFRSIAYIQLLYQMLRDAVNNVVRSSLSCSIVSCPSPSFYRWENWLREFQNVV